jgi:hypothetical protein
MNEMLAKMNEILSEMKYTSVLTQFLDGVASEVSLV